MVSVGTLIAMELILRKGLDRGGEESALEADKVSDCWKPHWKGKNELLLLKNYHKF